MNAMKYLQAITNLKRLYFHVLLTAVSTILFVFKYKKNNAFLGVSYE
jgi:hypothetical protein